MTRLAWAALALILAGPVQAHEAPTGWAYPWECCSDRDCAPETADVQATDFGWLVTATGETVPYGDKRIKESPDGEFHRCQVPGIVTLRCLYVPPMGF